jgi:hypothetical protein
MNPIPVGRLLAFAAPWLLSSVISAAEEVVIPRGDVGWKYLDSSEEPEANWSDADYDDAQWREGQALLGYGDHDIRTTVPFGGNVQNKRPVTFFRKLFQLRDRNRYRRYVGRVCCDDGAVVYVNRTEVYRRNMPQGEVTPATLAVRAVGPDTTSERRYVTFLVGNEVLRDGRNVVAVSVHQAAPTSSDLALDLELIGLETDEEIHKAEEAIRQQQDEAPSGDAQSASDPIVRFNLLSR